MNRRFASHNFVLSLIFLFLFFFAAKADEADNYVRAVMQERHIPGAAIAVIKNGKIIKTAGYGLASVEFNVPATPETVFEIGSVSKQLTATGIMLLVEDSKIALDQKISTILPNTPDLWKNVSVRNLLTHTSGIKSYSSLDGFELNRRLKRDDFIKLLGVQPLDFETGTAYVYSNSGYSLLGYIIETVSGKNYWDYMRERIFNPLKMTKTGDRDPQYIIPNRATGYEWQGGALVGRDYDLTDVFSAGAIVSTVGDLAKWDAALRNDSLLKKESKMQMWTPLTFNDGKNYPYGFGFRLSDVRGHKLVAHSGQTTGFGANISRYVDDDLTVIALTNLGEPGMGTLVANAVAKFYIPAISLRALKEQAGADASVTKMLETALRGNLENNINADLFTEEMQRSLATGRAKSAAKSIAAFGAIKNFIYVGGETSGKTRLYRYKVESQGRIMLWRFEVNENGKISAMSLEEEE